MKPIIFNSEMVRAILDGRKSQTRRVVKGDVHKYSDAVLAADGSGDVKFINEMVPGVGIARSDWIKCPYGKVGDELYVKETWCCHLIYDDKRPSVLPEIKYIQNGIVFMSDVYKGEKSTWMGKTRPSIFMPKRFSRITLSITDIRVERVQDISVKDAIKEGAFLNRCSCKEMNRPPKTNMEALFRQTGCHIHGTEFKALWDSINGKKHPWEENPWVWVITFKKRA